MIEELWREWIDLYKHFESKKIDTAALFSPHIPKGFRKSEGILYVGKATRDGCDKEKFDAALAQSVHAARQQSENFSKHIFENPPTRSGFFRFADLIASECCKNLAWSNLCKIGASRGNPTGELLRGQSTLSIQTLRTEIQQLQPRLVVFATGRFADNLILEALQLGREAWVKSEDATGSDIDGMWWREASAKSPAMLWMPHPGRLKRKLRDFAQAKAQELMKS